MKRLLTLLLIPLVSAAFAQKEPCGTFPYYQQVVKTHPILEHRLGFKAWRELAPDDGRIIEIPVYVHVLYKLDIENVPDEKIKEQIQLLNDDFAARNSDIDRVPDYFQKDTAGDCRIRFYLQDIIRKETSKDEFIINLDIAQSREADPIKFSEKGGSDIVSPGKYMNLWIGNIRLIHEGNLKGIAGYAPPPGGDQAYDGVVINYRYIGLVPGTSYDRGRTATHEVGHWLDLLHIWGKDTSNCGNDLVDDTPTQEKANFYCPEGKKKNCTDDPNGEMYMNYLDYVDDRCMVMFSAKQKERMRQCFYDNTKRGSFLKQAAFYPFHDSAFSGLPAITLPLVNSMRKINDKMIFTWDSAFNLAGLDMGRYSICLREFESGNCIEIGNIKGNAIAIEDLRPGAYYELIIRAKMNGRSLHEDYPYLFLADPRLPKSNRKPKLKASF